MGKAPAFIADDPVGDFSEGFDLKSKGCQTATNVGNKMFVIGGTDHESTAEIGVNIFDKSSGKWVTPKVLGTRPKPSKGHSALLLNEDRILIIKGDSAGGDCFWFLEVDTPYVREQTEKSETVAVAWSKGVIGGAEKPIVISGPSGVGKSRLINKLMEEFPSTFGFSVSHTTRARREKEENGVHYHFTERSVMEKEISNGKFLEYASVHGNLYGTSIEAVEAVADAGKRCILDIDVQGARSVRACSFEAIFIFVRPPSIKELENRLRARGTETEEQIQKRLGNAMAEIDQGKSPEPFDHILVNDNLETCYTNLKKLLGLNGGERTTHKASPVLVDLPVVHSVSKTKQKIQINFGAEGQDSKNMLELDLSSIGGGAPGRTRGLNISSVDVLGRMA